MMRMVREPVTYVRVKRRSMFIKRQMRMVHNNTEDVASIHMHGHTYTIRIISVIS